jgi:hypothetical protein
LCKKFGEIWVDEDFEMVAVASEIVGIYRAPNEDLRVIEELGSPNRLYGKLNEA